MSTTWNTDLQHYLDRSRRLAPNLSPEARAFSRFLGSVVEWVSVHTPGLHPVTNVPCRRRPGRQRCSGSIHAQVEDDGSTISWRCLECGDNGYIRGWQDTCWDRRRERLFP